MTLSNLTTGDYAFLFSELAQRSHLALSVLRELTAFASGVSLRRRQPARDHEIPRAS